MSYRLKSRKIGAVAIGALGLQLAPTKRGNAKNLQVAPAAKQGLHIPFESLLQHVWYANSPFVVLDYNTSGGRFKSEELQFQSPELAKEFSGTLGRLKKFQRKVLPNPDAPEIKWHIISVLMLAFCGIVILEVADDTSDSTGGVGPQDIVQVISEIVIEYHLEPVVYGLIGLFIAYKGFIIYQKYLRSGNKVTYSTPEELIYESSPTPSI